MTISFKAVSQPIERSVPGTLFEMVAGMHTNGILNSGYKFLFSLRSLTEVKASKPPIINRP